MVATSQIGKRLADCAPGVTGQIAYYAGNEIGAKLMAMGVLPGSMVNVLRFSPWGEGLYIKVDNQLIALRKEEAACIVMK